MKYLSLREVQLQELELLCCFDEICKKHSLRYSLAYGTLLGAVRHGGFIPWDDDIDVIMPRPDYEKLIEGVNNGTIKLKPYQELSKDRGKDLFSSFLKLFDKRIVNENSITNAFLWIDIFPVDGITDDKTQWQAIFDKTARLRHIITTHDDYIQKKNLSSFKDWLKSIYYTVLHTKRGAVNRINKLATKEPFGSTEYASNIAYGFGVFDIFKTEMYLNIGKISFEGKMFSAINDTDYYLSQRYGDYMQMPPEEQRRTHLSKFYLKEGKLSV